MPLMVELGNFTDLQTLVQLLNSAWKQWEYRLEPVEGEKGVFLFVEDPLQEDEYECGMIEKRGAKAYAFSQEVYELVMGAYLRYKDQFEK